MKTLFVRFKLFSLILGLSVAGVICGGEPLPVVDFQKLPFFDPYFNLNEQRSRNTLGFSYHATMTNPGIEPAAAGSVDAKMSIVRRSNNETFTILLSNLLPNKVYQLNAFIADDVAPTKAISITTDASGGFSALYSMGRRVRGSTPLPSVMRPINAMRELNVVNTNSQVVLRANLVDTSINKYLTTLRMHNPGFMPKVAGSVRISATSANIEIKLNAKNLEHSTNYRFLVNGMVNQTVTSDRFGRLKFTANEATLNVFDIRNLALTDKDGLHVILVLFPGSGNGIFPAHTTVPVVTSTDPSCDVTGVPVNATINATFNEGMDASTLNSTTFTLMLGSSPVFGVVTYNKVTATATLTLPNNLLPNTIYTATITTGAGDLGGNTLAVPYTWTFTTGTSSVSPIVVATDPTNLATSVAVTKQLSATFNVAMDPATINTSTFTLVQTVSGSAVIASVSYSGTTAMLTPSNDLLPSTNYTATITTGAKDTSAQPLAANFTWTFTTQAAAVAPAVVSTDPANLATDVPANKQLAATFNKAMNPTTISSATFTLKQTVSSAPVSGSVTYAGFTATFTPSTNLAANTNFTATITTGAKDLAGNPLASNFSWTFTTSDPDVTPPTVIATNPTDEASSVPIDINIAATFDKAMNATTISTLTFTLEDISEGAIPVAGAVTYDAITKIATFNPTTNLSSNHPFRATVTNGVKDVAANAMLVNKVWTFSTSSQQVQLPVVLGAAAPFGTFGGGAGMTNDGVFTVINGDIGTTAASTTVTGFHDSVGDIYTETTLNKGQVNGKIYTNGPPPGGAGVGGNAVTMAIATQAASDANTAYLNLTPASKPGGFDPGAGQLGGLTLAPGIYKSAGATFQITGSDLTLDGQGDPNAVWVFQMAASLTVGGPSAPRNVMLINGAQAKNVFWQVGSSATINAAGGGTMVGTIIASAGIAISTAGNVELVTLNGRALALNASTTLVNTVINVPAP